MTKKLKIAFRVLNNSAALIPHFQPLTPANIGQIAGFDCDNIDGTGVVNFVIIVLMLLLLLLLHLSLLLMLLLLL